MNYEDMVKQISPELYATFKRSLERGRWPDGREMTAEQREHCLQAVIAYDALHKPEQERVGFIDRARSQRDEKPLKWADGGEQDAPGDD